MKNSLKYIALVIVGTLVSCKDDAQKPKVIYDAASKTNVVAKTDSTQIEIADLPIQMEGTSYLIHPVGDLRVFEKGTKSFNGNSKVFN